MNKQMYIFVRIVQFEDEANTNYHANLNFLSVKIPPQNKKGAAWGYRTQ